MLSPYAYALSVVNFRFFLSFEIRQQNKFVRHKNMHEIFSQRAFRNSQIQIFMRGKKPKISLRKSPGLYIAQEVFLVAEDRPIGGPIYFASKLKN